jgi:hypothetical protein
MFYEAQISAVVTCGIRYRRIFMTDKSGGVREETVVVYFKALPTDILSYFHSHKEIRGFDMVSLCESVRPFVFTVIYFELIDEFLLNLV